MRRLWFVRKGYVGELVLVMRIPKVLCILEDGIECMHPIACEKADLADEALGGVNDQTESLRNGNAHRDTAGRERTPREADQHNLICGFVIGADEIVRLANVLPVLDQ